MSETGHEESRDPLGRLLARWQGMVWRRAWLVLLLTVLLCVLAVRFITGNLGINTDTADMISETLPWRMSYLEYEREFPQFADTITIVVDAATADESRDAALALAARLREEEDLFDWVYLPSLSSFFRRNGLLYLEVPALESLADRIAGVQPFLARLQADPSLRGLFDLLAEASAEYAGGNAPPMAAPLSAIDRTIQTTLAGDHGPPARLSWEALLTGDSADGMDRRSIIQVKPHLDFTRLLPGETAVLRIRELARELQVTPANGIHVRQTGGAALGYEELQSVSEGARQAGLLAMVMVAVVLTLGLRSATLVIATLLTLAAGLIFTAAFATLAIGQLNMISVAFAVLYIGLGVDFAIHYCLRYRDLNAAGQRHGALLETSRHIGASLVVCAMTTAVGFYAFVPTAYSGVAELGLISGTGMFVSLVVSLTVLPAMLRYLPAPRPPRRTANPGAPWHALPIRRARPIVIGAAVLGGAGVLVMPGAEFDHNPIHLHDARAESVQTYRDLLEHSRLSPLSISALAPDAATAERWRTALKALPSVHSVATLQDMVPGDQAEKRYIIEDLRLILGSTEAAAAAPAPASAEVRAALGSLRDALEAIPETAADADGKALLSLRDTLATLAQALDRGDASTAEMLLERLQSALLGNLPGRLQALRESLQAGQVRVDTLPSALRERWRSPGGRFRVEVWPQQDLDDNGELETFVGEVRSVVGNAATGAPIVNVEASNAVTDAFAQAFSYALIANVLVIWFMLKRLRDVLLVLVPLLLAAVLTGAVTVVLGIPFNFANIIALPLLLGMGVDSAVHMLHRQRTEPAAADRVLGTSTARGVVFSALTTTCGFGNLALSPHAGTASMGLLLTLGVMFTLLTTLVLLPALMAMPFFRTRDTT